MKTPLTSIQAKQNARQRKSGYTLMIVLGAMAVMGMVSAGFLYTAAQDLRTFNNWRDSDVAFVAAQETLEQAKVDIQETFKNYYYSSAMGGTAYRWENLDWFASFNNETIGRDGKYYYLPKDETSRLGPTCTVEVLNYRQVNPTQRELILSVTAQYKGAERRVNEVVRFGLSKSRVFDYLLFINNFGWICGDEWGYAKYNGDVRANGDFRLDNKPTISGDIYAAANEKTGASGKITGASRYLDINSYRYYGNHSSRQTDPPSSSYEGTWEMGYKGTSTRYEGVDELPMPYLGDLENYKFLATASTGRIYQGNTLLVKGVYDGPGPDGKKGTADDGTLVLNADNSNNTGGWKPPLRIEGPIVATGDVIIKGNYTGQGTIYAGRNIHIIGNVIADKPAQWYKPDNQPEKTAEANKKADFLGLACKGNIVIGNYTLKDWQDKCLKRMQPGISRPYETDPTDANLGYDSDRNSKNGYVFDGDYSALDGGMRLDNDGKSVPLRRYYESCLSPKQFDALCGPTIGKAKDWYGVRDTEQIDAVLYNNHMVAGTFQKYWSRFNGAIVTRDLAIWAGKLYASWDARLGSNSKDAEGVAPLFYVPMSLDEPQTVLWNEG